MTLNTLLNQYLVAFSSTTSPRGCIYKTVNRDGYSTGREGLTTERTDNGSDKKSGP